MLDNYELEKYMNKNKVLEILKNIDKELNMLWEYSVDILYEIVKKDSFKELKNFNLKEEYLRAYYKDEQFYQEIVDIMSELLNYYFFKSKDNKKVSNKECKIVDIEFPFEYECERMSLSNLYSLLSNYDMNNKIIINSTDNKEEILNQLSNLKTCKKIGMVSMMGHGIYREFFGMNNGNLLMIKCVSTKDKYYVREMIIYKKRG